MAKKNTNKMVENTKEMILNAFGIETKKQKRRRIIGTVISGTGTVLVAAAPLILEALNVETAPTAPDTNPAPVQKPMTNPTPTAQPCIQPTAFGYVPNPMGIPTPNPIPTPMGIPTPNPIATPTLNPIPIPIEVKEISEFFKLILVNLPADPVDDPIVEGAVVPKTKNQNQTITRKALCDIEFIKFDIEGNLRKLDKFISDYKSKDENVAFAIISGRIKELVAAIKHRTDYRSVENIVAKANRELRNLEVFKHIDIK